MLEYCFVRQEQAQKQWKIRHALWPFGRVVLLQYCFCHLIVILPWSLSDLVVPVSWLVLQLCV